jgi:hypothetical protein
VDRAEVHRRVEAEALEFFNRVLRAIRRSRTLGRLKPQLVPSRADENSQRPAGVDGGVDLHATRCAARNVKRFLSALVKLTATMRALKEGRRLGRWRDQGARQDAPPARRWSETGRFVAHPTVVGAPLTGRLLVGHRLPAAIAPILSTIAKVLPSVAAIFASVDPILYPITQTTIVPRVPTIFPAIGSILASVRTVFQSIDNVLNPVALVRVWRVGQRTGDRCRGQQRTGTAMLNTRVILLPQSRRWGYDGGVRRGVVGGPIATEFSQARCRRAD